MNLNSLVRGVWTLAAAGWLGGSAASAASFAKDIRPVLEAHCSKCHNAEKRKGGVDFSSVADESSIARQRKMWRAALTQVGSREMPPEGEKALSPEQRELLLNWLNSAAKADCNDPATRDPGPALVRRLNRAEYNLTIRDLVGLEFDAGEQVGMPDDGVVTGFDNLATALNLPPTLLEKYFAAADKILDRVFSVALTNSPVKLDGNRKKEAQKAHDALVFVKPGNELSERAAAQQVVGKFARRAYRRPLAGVEVERLMKVYDRAAGEGFESGLRAALKPVLVSPHFLFRIEQDRAQPGAFARVNDHELATRLAYFLWSSLPDEELSTLAEQGKLSDSGVLEQQVKRMLADAKARALTEQFAVQWLQLGKLANARPSTEFFPTFTSNLRRAMRDEATLFFEHLRTADRSVLELLDADYTFANADLAKHYGLAAVEGVQMRRVSLRPEDHRGGLLGMGGVLAMTSHTHRTSPTQRGKYVLEVLFGTPPPPPPANASQLKEERNKKDPKSFREQLTQHASDATCAGCHKKMDPLGFALDNYDAVGSWRESKPENPLDTTGQLPTGEKLTGAADLKQVLWQRRDQFTRNLAEQLLAYALGRELEFFDECPVNEIQAALAKEEFRFSALVLGVVKSLPFQNRRGPEQNPVAAKQPSKKD
ncbi:MAG: hypothetical protein RL514_1773 [Verrucomicrobiota bacterium]|jgi:cytochrome c553